jgi:PhoH-like ATPase
MSSKLVVVDTSALMQSLKVVEETAKDYKLVITSIVLEELDKHKDCNDPNRSFKSRQALKFINNNEDKIEFSIEERMTIHDMLNGFDPEKNDNKILSAAFKMGASVLTYDIGMKVKARHLRLDVIDTYEYDEDYKGYIEIEGTNNINSLYEAIETGDLKLLHNQYVILKEEGTKDKVLRWDGKDLVTVNIPHYAKTLKAKNSLQLAALDIMFNPDIPIKVICGQYGSGKTFLAVKASKLMLDEGKADKMLLVRNPVPADGIDIGALPGDKNDKVGSYFKPMLQYLETDFNMFDPEAEKRAQAIECEIVSFMKGISVDHTIMIVDEAEDLNL